MELLNAINAFYYYMSLNELRMMHGGDTVGGISYNSLLYLNVVEQTENCTVSAIAKALGVTKSAVTIKVNELERQGLLQKTQSESDRRVHYLSLSEKMKSAFTLYDTAIEGIDERLRTRYSQEELEVFCKILREVYTYEWKGPEKS